jgi:hypothetical protein
MNMNIALYIFLEFSLFHFVFSVRGNCIFAWLFSLQYCLCCGMLEFTSGMRILLRINFIFQIFLYSEKIHHGNSYFFLEKWNKRILSNSSLVEKFRFWINFYSIYIKKLQKYYCTIFILQNITFVLLIKKVAEIFYK